MLGIGVSFSKFSGGLGSLSETKSLEEKTLCHILGKAKNRITV
jgi:hypothetical protein